VAGVATLVNDSNKNVKPSEDGWPLYEHLAHIQLVRKFWMKELEPEGAKGLTLRAYVVSQRLDSPALAAALYLVTFSLVALDPVLPGRGGILFCAGDVRRRRGNQSGRNSDDSHSR